MRRLLTGLLVIIALAVLIIGIKLRSSLTHFEANPLTDDLYMLSNIAGGNVALLKTGEGSVIVDTLTFTFQGEALKKFAEELTGEPVIAVINTHYHFDHSHGNPGFAPEIRFIATERTLHHLNHLDSEHFSGDNAFSLPNETFDESKTHKLGNKTIELIHLGKGHTDGDLIVRFVEDNAIHAGDLFFNKHYPNIDLEAGGSVQQWSHTLDNVLELDFTQVIPGHGDLSDRFGLVKFRDFMKQLAELGQYAVNTQATLIDTQVNGVFTEDEDYKVINLWPLLYLDREFVIRRAWEEATGNYEHYEGFNADQ